ncbi:MAG: NAD-dependent epimerase/dehydratase family protein [Chitinispirillaceae bacterium]|nr:NAD-dependent epimerase/dehydratase family protein [Chitinispirillaceae bacterium]
MSDDRTATIALLGCGGFIGSHLLERILDATDYRVEGIDLSSRKIAAFLGRKRLTFHTMNVHDVAAMRPVIERCGTVISLAALCNPYLYTHTPIDVIESNFVKIYPLVQACSESGCRLIHFSTSEVYGRTLTGAIDGADPRHVPVSHLLDETATPLLLGPIAAQRWCYASAKQLLERAVFAYGFERGLEYTIVRPFNFIGPRMDFIPGIDGEGVPRVLACFMDALLHDTSIRLVDGGTNRRCFTAIRDAVDAVMLILERRHASRQRIFNIGNPANETTIAALASRMIDLYRELRPEAAGRNFSVEPVTSREFYGEGYEDSDRRVPAVGAIAGALGWTPKIGLVDALRSAMEGFIREYGMKCRKVTGAFRDIVRETV